LELSLLGYLAFMFVQEVIKLILGRYKIVPILCIKSGEDV
jgi:hypothetical protein